ncbi:sulfurtransferase TusA family protein [Melghirimyces algeriensis]|uniref:Rhodanese-related sulfurtransferase n=1 Tax=Melghirimyces algeriensis TaxID=910412 RepID=A0A521EK19_9BACL|nr:sulfurtransferase TusA family protein [Melghirimyces algeriensis]SMO83490.1 Rhodanese-related sulfurtransferase [Melghirimyces algeriensis]
MTTSYQVDKTLDCKGLSCPMPVIQTKKAVEALKPGQILQVEATDKGSLADLKSWAQRTGHHYLGSKEDGDVIRHFLRKAAEGKEKHEKTYPHVANLEEMEQKRNDPDVEIVDVREPMEYTFGHIPGAKSIPLGELEERISELNPTKEYYVICQTGTRSDAACQLLNEKGFSKVKNVVPGMKEWNKEMEKD